MELDLHRNFLPMGDLIIWLDKMDKTDLTVLDEDEEQLYKEVQQAVLMASGWTGSSVTTRSRWTGVS